MHMNVCMHMRGCTCIGVSLWAARASLTVHWMHMHMHMHMHVSLWC